jgi:AraC family transcriptional regulator
MASKVISEGRIVVWQGASLWVFDVLAERDSRENRMHAHHAFQVTMAAGGTANIRTGESLIEGPLILIAPNVPHAIEPVGRIAILFIEPESRAGAALRRLLRGDPIVRRDAMPGVDAILRGLWRDPRPTDAEIATIGSLVLEQFVGSEPADPVRDPRITRVLVWLGAQEGERDVTAADAAGVACLSESRFSHVFVKEVGLPFRTFLLWRRLTRAVDRMAAGDSLTVAAHQAGFADSAHFSRTFHRMFGLPAAWLELIRPTR